MHCYCLPTGAALRSSESRNFCGPSCTEGQEQRQGAWRQHHYNWLAHASCPSEREPCFSRPCCVLPSSLFLHGPGGFAGQELLDERQLLLQVPLRYLLPFPSCLCNYRRLTAACRESHLIWRSFSAWLGMAMSAFWRSTQVFGWAFSRSLGFCAAACRA